MRPHEEEPHPTTSNPGLKSRQRAKTGGPDTRKSPARLQSTSRQSSSSTESVGSRRSPCNGQRPVTPGLLPFGRNVPAALGIDTISPDPCGTRNAGEKAPCPAPASHWAASVQAVAHHPAPATLRRNRNPTRLQPRRALRPQKRTSAGCIAWTPGAVNTGLASSSLAATFPELVRPFGDRPVGTQPQAETGRAMLNAVRQQSRSRIAILRP